jgi:cell division protein FtsA
MTIHRHGRPNYGRASGEIVAALDIGTHKVCCLIARLEPAHPTADEGAGRLRLLGIGHQRSQGIACGAVADLDAAEAVVAAAINEAEQAAGLRVERIVLGVSAGRPRSRTFDGHIDLTEGIVREADVAGLDSGARAYAARDGDALLCINRISYELDGVAAVRQPLGLAGRRLKANHHAVIIAPGPLRNLCQLAESCDVEPAQFLPTGFASALAATTEAERRSGVVVVDLGAGVTSLAGFLEGHFVFYAALPLGGQQATEELAQVLSVSLAEAERIKTLYASLARTALDEHEYVDLPREAQFGVATPAVTRAVVGQVAEACAGRLFEQVRQQLEGCGIEAVRRAGVVLTGGASGFMGLEVFASAALGRQVRVAGPTRLEGMSARGHGRSAGPAFSAVVGLAMSVASPTVWLSPREEAGAAGRGYLGRVGQWLRDSF